MSLRWVTRTKLGKEMKKDAVFHGLEYENWINKKENTIKLGITSVEIKRLKYRKEMSFY